MTTSPGLSTRSMTVWPGIESPSANVARRCSIARSLSRRSISSSSLPSASGPHPVVAQLAALVSRLGRGPLDLAARRPSDGSAPDDRDLVDVQPEEVADLAADGAG